MIGRTAKKEEDVKEREKCSKKKGKFIVKVKIYAKDSIINAKSVHAE